MGQLSIYDAPTWTTKLPAPKRLAKNGYVAYLPEGAPSNSGAQRIGFGATPTEAIQASTYWANQWPWVRVVRADAAPRWVHEALQYQREIDLG